MARLESPALMLAEFGDEKLWREVWRFTHFHVRHYIRCFEHLHGQMTVSQKIRMAKTLLKAVNQREFGTCSYREYLQYKQQCLAALQHRLNGPPDAKVGGVSLYKVHEV